MLAGAILSLLFEYVPGLSGWYEGQTGTTKRLVMLGAIVVVAAAVYGLSCFNTPWIYVECSTAGLFDLLLAIVAAITANQGVYLLTKRPQ
jgi:hypothetical protein